MAEVGDVERERERPAASGPQRMRSRQGVVDRAPPPTIAVCAGRTPPYSRRSVTCAIRAKLTESAFAINRTR